MAHVYPGASPERAIAAENGERVNHPNVLVVDHPAVADRLARLRDKAAPTPVFRKIVEELGQFLAYEATRGLALRDTMVETPVATARAYRIATRPVVAPILRAGLGLLPGFLSVIDDAVIAHLGFYRDPQTLAAIPYYANLPDDLVTRDVFVVDPMLATGHSGSAALTMLEARGAQNMTFVCIIAAPDGIATLLAAHPTVRIVTGAIDDRLNDHGYIVPGLGDAGDRMFGSTSSVPVSVRPT
ncbi:MAG: uracil phosphoribosyltransferase [Candidatus Velthaea sp.]